MNPLMVVLAFLAVVLGVSLFFSWVRAPRDEKLEVVSHDLSTLTLAIIFGIVATLISGVAIAEQSLRQTFVCDTAEQVKDFAEEKPLPDNACGMMAGVFELGKVVSEVSYRGSKYDVREVHFKAIYYQGMLFPAQGTMLYAPVKRGKEA